MALDSTSTLAEIRAEYADNSLYAENDSAAQCKAFIQACRMLLMRQPRRSAHGGRGSQEVEIDLGVVERQLAAAQHWYARKTRAAIVHPSFQDFRE